MDNVNFRLSYEKRMSLGVLLLLNAPKMMKFGIDMSEWTIGAKFLGVKLIPYGMHYISFALKDEEYQSKQGFFINVTKNNLKIVKKFSDQYQTFISLKEEDDMNFKIGIDNLDFDSNLGDYPIQQEANWVDLANFITIDVMNKIQPESRKFLIEKNEYNSNIYINKDINFTEFQQKVYNLNKYNKEHLSQLNIDKTKLFEDIIKEYYSGNKDNILGELQYAFIVFLIGESYEGLTQWKNIICLLSSCEEGINKYQKFFCDYIEVLYNQLRNLPRDLFYDEIIGNNFLKRYIDRLVQYTDNNNSLNDNFTKRIILFKKFLNEFFGYEIETEENKVINIYLNNKNIDYYYNNEIDDELPIIVDQKEIEAFNKRNHMEID